MDESSLLYREGEPDADGTGRQVVFQLPEGCDTADGVVMQIEGDKIHIITQGGQLGDNPLGLAMESIMSEGPDAELQPADDSVTELRVTDAEEEAEEMEDGQHVHEQQHMKEPVMVECFVCSLPCLGPVPLLLTRLAGSGASLAERLGALLPLRLHCSAADGVCGGCRELIDQADQHYTELKSVELQVRQLFRLEERLEEEEQRQEEERCAALRRQQALRARQEEEQRRHQQRRIEAEQRRESILSRLSAARQARGTSEAVLLSSDGGSASGADVRVMAAPEAAGAVTGEGTETAPPPPAGDLTDDDWTVKKYCWSRRRRRPRRPWSPTDYGGDDLREQQQDKDPLAQQDQPAPDQQDQTAPDQQDQPAPDQQDQTAPDQQDQPAPDQQDQTAPDQQDQTPPDQQAQPAPAQQDQPAPAQQDPTGTRDPDGVQTTTIEFVSLNGPHRRGGHKPRLLSLRGRRRGRRLSHSFYCRRCDTTFESSSSLVEHITSQHSRPWCRRCRCEFDTAGQLSQHRRRCRSQCSLCGQRPLNLARHLHNKHPGSVLIETQPDRADRPDDRQSADIAMWRPGRHRSSPAPSPSTPGQPTVIEYRDVSTLREQVKNVKTPRFSLKFRRASASDLEKIQHLSVGNRPLVTAAGEPAGRRPDTNRPHTCLRCGEHLASVKEQVVHLHTVHKGKSWCRRCRTEFPDKQANLEHRAECRRVHAAGTCPHCGKLVKNLKMHLRTHEVKSDRALSEVGPDGKTVSASLAGGKCDICDKYVPHRLKRHIASHAQHPCPICKKLFSREDVISGHIKRVHMKERPHICNHCGKGFVSLYSMQRHEMIHTNSYRFYCQECGDGFRQKQQLTTHMRHKHGVMEIEFEDVQESCDILSAIRDGVVTTELRFYCQECGSGFHSRRLLTAHMRIKHGVANVVFEDVQLHVAGIEQLEAVTVADQETGQAGGTATVRQLTQQATDPADTGADRQTWWNPDHTTEY